MKGMAGLGLSRKIETKRNSNSRPVSANCHRQQKRKLSESVVVRECSILW